MKSWVTFAVLLVVLHFGLCHQRSESRHDDEFLEDLLEDANERDENDDDEEEIERGNHVEAEDDIEVEHDRRVTRIQAMRDTIAKAEDALDTMKERVDAETEDYVQTLITPDCDPCLQNFAPIGCYVDTLKTRPLPYLLDNHRVKAGRPGNDKEIIDWGHYDTSLQHLACHCAVYSRGKGYTVFGLQYYGECFSGPTYHESYAQYGATKTCINGEFKTCNGTTERICTGEGYTNFVYKLDPLPPPQVSYAKVGCFKDIIDNRALPILLVNHRNKASEYFHSFSWEKYRETVIRLLQQCAKLAKERGFKMIGLQFYGECWSGEQSGLNYHKHGPSGACVNPGYKKCNKKTDCNCIGKGHTNFVYRIL